MVAAVNRIIERILYSNMFSSLCQALKVKNVYLCPICGYCGLFQSVKPKSGLRKRERCPKCGSLERHRLQLLVFNKVVKEIDTKKMSMLHFAPEDCLRNIFKKINRCWF